MLRITVRDIGSMKRKGEKVPMITAYDYTGAQLAEAAGFPLVLVGDTLGMVVFGHETTIPVSMEDMLSHARAVARGTVRALVVMDLPFMSYQVSAEEGLRSAGRAFKEGAVQAVKLEGGERVAKTVRCMVEAGMPTMGHIGLTPQSVYAFGGYRSRGRVKEEALELVQDAQVLEEAGAFALVLELIPGSLARLITRRLGIPTIGIGSGPHCDGQVQVFHDVLGLFTDFVPKHTRPYVDGFKIFENALKQCGEDIRSGSFPSESESLSMDESLIEELEAALG